jgi:hypothetical protein
MPPSKNVVMAFNPENLSGPRPDFFPPALNAKILQTNTFFGFDDLGDGHVIAKEN